MDINDTEAIALYVAAGNPREDWAALDDRDRWPWRKMALERRMTGFLATLTDEQRALALKYDGPDSPL
jgi:hypothetical protein